MQNVIWKYPIQPTVDMPVEAEIIHVGLDPNGVPCLWVGLPWPPSDDDPTETRYFDIVGAGQPWDADCGYRGTFLQGSFVWHVIEKPNQ